MVKFIICFVLFQIILINSKSLHNHNNNANNIDSSNTSRSEISRNFAPPRSDVNHNKSDNILTFPKFKFVNKSKSFKTNRFDSNNSNNNNNRTAIIKEEHLINVNEGRGEKKKMKKKLKMLTPMLLIMLAAKSIFLPFLLKGLTIVTASSFIISKISLVLSLLILLRLLYTQGSDSKLEIHSVPIRINKHGWNDRQASGSYGEDINNWDDMSYSNTNYSSAFPYNHFQI